ncbi:MAG: hypothetical protein WBH50_20845 [Fuerstiella sp.]
MHTTSLFTPGNSLRLLARLAALMLISLIATPSHAQDEAVQAVTADAAANDETPVEAAKTPTTDEPATGDETTSAPAPKPAEPPQTTPPTGAAISTSASDDGARTIIIKGPAEIPEPALFYSAIAKATANVGIDHVEQSIDVTLKIVQGKATTVSLGINGPDSVLDVTGGNLKAWSVRQQGSQRFLDLTVRDADKRLIVKVNLRSVKYDLKQPVAIELTHLTPGDALGFDCVVNLQYAAEIEAAVTAATGFAPLDSSDGIARFQSPTGGQIKLMLNKAGASPAAVELTNTTLKGNVHANGDSILFQFAGTANVTEANAEITILSGNAAVTEVPTNANYRLRLTTQENQTVYKLVFPEAGTFAVSLDFVAGVTSSPGNVRSMDFVIGASAVVPLTLTGLAPDLDFHRDQESVVPLHNDDNWMGFLPATGRAKLSWKTARKTGDGKLFFSTTGTIEAQVGAGLLRQNHQIDYQVLQGELNSIRILLQGPGEILDVQGTNIVGWTVTKQGEDRLLEATLSQPITGTSQIKVRSQTALGAFPVRVEGLRLSPIGAIRHSGFLRITNAGSVRLEPTELSGLTQLAPEQFPAAAIEARQIFVYRFPAADHAFTVAADRIEPEVNVSQLVLYELAETDRVIKADIELDVREAPIREWDFGIPADYSVVSVTGASVADYIAASTVVDGRRNLKVVFGKDVVGRQLVTLHLEKSEVAAAGNWVLQRIEYPGAKTVRGAIGIVGAPGFRVVVGQTDLLVEKPLSYFPKQSAQLQQAFRIREPAWSATMQIELLERNVQSDVFHLYSLSQETVYGSALINYFVTGAPVSEWKIAVPETMGNVMVDGQDVRTWRREADTLIVSLHQPVMGAYTLLVTFEEKPDKSTSTFQAGQLSPTGVQGERGYIQVVSPMQVEIETVSMTDDMLKLDPLELPAEFRLLSTAPPLGTWQYTDRPFSLNLKVKWFEPGSTVDQVVEFSEANSRVSQDGELVTDVLYYVKSRGQRTLRIQIPADPVRLWEVSVNGQPVTARQADDATLIPLPGGTDPNIPIEVRLRLGKPTVKGTQPKLTLPIVFAPVLKTQWDISGDEHHVLVPTTGTVKPPVPVLRPSGFEWVAQRGIVSLFVIGLLACIGIWMRDKSAAWRILGLAILGTAILGSYQLAVTAYSQIRGPEPLQLSLPILAAGETVELQVSSMPVWQVNLSWVGLAAALTGIALLALSFRKFGASQKMMLRCVGMLAIAMGVLLQGDSAAWFFGLLGITILVLFVRPAYDGFRDLGRWVGGVFGRWKANRKTKREPVSPEASSA